MCILGGRCRSDRVRPTWELCSGEFAHPSWPSSSMLVLDFGHSGRSSRRSLCCTGSSVSFRGGSAGVIDVGARPPALAVRRCVRSFDCVGSRVSSHGPARLGSVLTMSVLDFLHLGSSQPLRSSGRVGSAVSGMCLARVGSVLMSVPYFVHFGRSVSLRLRSADSGALLGRFHTGTAGQVCHVGA